MSKIKEIIVVSKEGKDAIGYESVSIASHEVRFSEKALSHSFLLDSFRKLMGKTLTMIDAAIQDKHQNKAMKDLVRNTFSDEMNFASEMCFDQKAISASINEADIDLDSTVTVEEVLGVENR